MQPNYWSTVLNQRLSRRRALAATGTTAAAAAFLAACGGGDSGGGAQTKDKSGLLHIAEDTTKQAVPGGVWQSTVEDTINLDPIAQNTSNGFSHTSLVYSKPVKFGMGKNLKIPGPETISGEVAESWELTPDATQITLRLRQDHKFDMRPPTNGRTLTVADFKWSWERFATGSSFRSEILNKLSDAGMIDTVTFPDNRTVVIKLAFPYAPILEMLAAYQYFNIMPVEAEDKFDPRREMRGSGPFMLTEYIPSSYFHYQKNPNWYVKDRPFLDGIRRTIIPDYPATLAQLENKAIWEWEGIRAEDVLGVKKRHPEIVLQQFADEIGYPQFGFYAFSSRPNSPFRDQRVRQAASMMWDREAFIDTVYNLTQFREAGLPSEGMWNSHMHGGQLHWIDPRNKEFGPNAKYFMHDVAEAKKLVSAAGFAGGVPSTPMNYRANTTARQYEILLTMMNENNVFQMKTQIVDEPTYRNLQAAKGDFDGMTPFTNGGVNEESWFVNMLTPGGKFAVSTQPIPQITDKVVRTRREVDANKRNELVKELQRDIAADMTCMLLPGYAISLKVHWPWLKNYGTFVAADLDWKWSSSRTYTEYWYDKSAQL